MGPAGSGRLIGYLSCYKGYLNKIDPRLNKQKSTEHLITQSRTHLDSPASGLPFSSLESLYSNTLRTYTTGQVLQAFLNLGYRPP